MRKRKVRGSAPRDLGAPFDAPLTSSPNAFDLTDVNRWKDLAPKLMLTLARAHALRGGFRGPEARATIASTGADGADLATYSGACSGRVTSPSLTRFEGSTATATG